jgi:DedD protein
MAFFKFRTRGPQGNEGRSAPAAVPAESVESMRRRARHRLLGAAVLVLLGVIGFPLLFDTQPRPVSVDIPIEIPDRNKVKPLPVPATPAPPPAPRPPHPTTARAWRLRRRPAA